MNTMQRNDRVVELVSILRRVMLFTAHLLERWLARQGVSVRNPTPNDIDAID